MEMLLKARESFGATPLPHVPPFLGSAFYTSKYPAGWSSSRTPPTEVIHPGLCLKWRVLTIPPPLPVCVPPCRLVPDGVGNRLRVSA